MRRIAWRISLTALALCSLVANAQVAHPSQVDIPLPGLQRLADTDLQVSLAPLVSDRLVVESWQATLGQASPAAAAIRVESTQSSAVLPVELRLVVEWPRGRMQQDYRLGIEGSSLRAEPLSVLRFGPTDARMNLYRLADLLRPDSISINQMMLRLLADNPNAFAIEHVNALEVDRYLQVPAVGSSGYLSAEQADAIVSRQLDEWESVALNIEESLPRLAGVQTDVARSDHIRQQLAEENQRLGARISALQNEVLALTQANRAPVAMAGEAAQAPPAETSAANVIDDWRALGLVMAGLVVIVWWLRRRRHPVDELLIEVDEQVNKGQLDAAQEKLDVALGQAPERIDWRLRLLQILAYREDAVGFESEAYVLHAQLDDKNDPRWQEVARRGRVLLPEHPLFNDN